MKEQNNKYLTDLIDKCTNCGNCRIICPAYKYTGEEIYSTRGRINLIKGLANDELQPSSEMKNILSVCLNCRQCLRYCPAEVEYFSIIRYAKNRIRNRNRIFDVSTFFSEGLFSNKHATSEMFFSATGFFRKLIYKNNKLNFLGRLMGRSARLRPVTDTPSIARRNFFEMGIRHQLNNGRGIRAALFTGCGGKYLYPEAADRFVMILRYNGIETLIPKEQVCCGNPLSYKGLLKKSENVLKKNAEVYNQLIGLNCIVSLCSDAVIAFKERSDSGKEPKFRFPVLNWLDFLLQNKIQVIPEYENSIIFHSCPKCGDFKVYENFIKKIYSDHTRIPEFSHDYCGSTELLDRSNPDLRDRITKDFCVKNGIAAYSYIACSSFECADHLNAYFSRNQMNVKAIHFVQALRPGAVNEPSAGT